MAERVISWSGVLLRVAVGVAVVLGTWNPSGHSFSHWVISSEIDVAVKALAAAVLLAAWALCLRTASRSLGTLGLVLCALVLGTAVWVLVDFGIVDLDHPSAVAWIVLALLGGMLGIGLSWSLIRQRVTGQVEVD